MPLQFHVYQLHDGGPSTEELEDDISAANHWLLPSGIIFNENLLRVKAVWKSGYDKHMTSECAMKLLHAKSAHAIAGTFWPNPFRSARKSAVNAVCRSNCLDNLSWKY